MPISTESSNGGDITADQEFLWPTLINLDSAKELRLLRDRIAQLERQQEVNSPNSSASFDLVAQNENDEVDTLYSQNEIEPNNDKESIADHEEEQTNPDQLEEKIKQIELELKGMKRLKEEVSAKMEEYQKQQQVAIDGKIGKDENSAAVSIPGQWWRCDPYRIAGAIVLFIFVIYTAHRLNEQNENRLKMNATVVAELEGQKLSNAFKFTEIEQKNDKLEKYQKEQQQNMEEYKKEQKLNISDLQKTVATFRKIVPPNRWDSAVCHDKLALIGPDRLIVQHNGKLWGWNSVLAEQPVPKNPYFEVQILRNKGAILIGLASKQMPLDKHGGDHEGTYGYSNWGKFWGHEVEGCFYDEGRPYITGKPEFEEGDVVGCGVNLKNGQIIYTLNGERLETAGLFVDSAADLFPCVSLARRGTKIEANFGPDFQFNIANGI
uniref:B30.2/SPRY domain-containing protein n=2 Tax=Globodera rostochiensis TaxID=31243 RepID=A0A914IDW5_GLORO